jgi:hypothetical protein
LLQTKHSNNCLRVDSQGPCSFVLGSRGSQPSMRRGRDCYSVPHQTLVDKVLKEVPLCKTVALTETPAQPKAVMHESPLTLCARDTHALSLTLTRTFVVQRCVLRATLGSSPTTHPPATTTIVLTSFAMPWQRLVLPLPAPCSTKRSVRSEVHSVLSESCANDTHANVMCELRVKPWPRAVIAHHVHVQPTRNSSTQTREAFSIRALVPRGCRVPPSTQQSP